jgi:ABC-type glycerol-3-phosphate transport system substrate-binding protein
LTGGAGDAQDELVDRYNAAQNEILVTSEFQGGYVDLATKLMTAVVSGEGPDVTQLGTFEIRQFATAGALVDLTGYVESADGLDTSDWPGTMLDAGRVGDGLYWLPFNVTVPVLYYNPVHFEEAGLNGPPETWAEFYEFARALSRSEGVDKPARKGVALWNITWPLVSAIWSEGGRLTTKDYASVTLDDPVAVEVLTAFQKLVKEGAAVMPDAASGGHRAAFINGQASMILDSPAPFEQIMESAVGFTPAVAPYPAGSAGKVYAPGGGGLAMLSTAPEENRAAAWAFMKYMLSPEQIARYAERSGYTAFTGASRERAGDWIHEDGRATIHEALAHLRGDFSLNMSPALRNAFDQAFQRIMIEMAGVREALEAADARAEAALVDERRGP